jgi:2'-5' RNA ligase
METAIAMPLPEVGAVIDDLRLKHTKAGAEFIPAHVTLLAPFADSESLSRRDLELVATIVDRFRAFDVRLATLRYFEAEEAVLYLAPEPSDPFVQMIEAFVEAFPAYPPYGRAHQEHIPHVTIGQGDRSTLEPLEREIAPRLPLVAKAETVWLFQRDEEQRWHPRQAFPLAK